MTDNLHLATGMGNYRSPDIIFDDPEITDAPGIYHLFAGADYEPNGGLGDYQGGFPTLAEAFACFDKGYRQHLYNGSVRYDEADWGHIVTVKDDRLVIFLEYRSDWIGTTTIRKGWKRPQE